MYTTPIEVMAVTPYTNVTLAQVLQAQFVVEVYTGRTEAEVDGARDKEMLARATAAQVVYMRENPEVTFEQIAAASISRGDGQTTFRPDGVSPFIAPLAVMACAHLSWKKSRSITLGKTVSAADRMRALYWLAVWGSYADGLDGVSGDYGTIPFDPEVWRES
jgi:hypothetical protein